MMLDFYVGSTGRNQKKFIVYSTFLDYHVVIIDRQTEFLMIDAAQVALSQSFGCVRERMTLRSRSTIGNANVLLLKVSIFWFEKCLVGTPVHVRRRIMLRSHMHYD